MLSAHQDDCFANISQDFLICTTIHKARQLGVYESDIFVRVTLDKIVRQTKTYKNSENPYFNEYFVFELKCTLNELLRLTILYEVKKRTTCKGNPTMGELLVDMQSVWHQPNRCYFKKWGRLESSIGQQMVKAVVNAAAEGYESGKGVIQIDLAIVTQASNTNSLLRPPEDANLLGMNKWQINHDYDDIEKNLLENAVSDIATCNIRYRVTLYRGIMLKKSDYLIQYRFHPFRGKTSVAKTTRFPLWNQEINFIWFYPSLANCLVLQLLSHEQLQWKCIAEYELHFDEIAFKAKPSLGPTFINFYDNLNAYQYVGRLLIQIQSECLEGTPNREMFLRTIQSMDEKRYWKEEFFQFEFLPIQGDFLHVGNVSNCKIKMKLGEYETKFIECFLKSYSTKKSSNTENNLKYFRNEAPFKAIGMRQEFPDNRLKYESNILLKKLIDLILKELEYFKLFQIYYEEEYWKQLKVLRSIIAEIIEKMTETVREKNFELALKGKHTQWDENRLQYLQLGFLKVLMDLKVLKTKLVISTADMDMTVLIESAVQDIKASCRALHDLLFTTRAQDEWPHLLLFLCANGNEIGCCRLNIKSFLFYTHLNRGLGAANNLCWNVRDFIFKDIQCQHSCVNCGCTIGVIRGCLGIVADRERKQFYLNIAKNWSQTESFYWLPVLDRKIFQCRLFIHQAKIRAGTDKSGLCNPYLRVTFSSNAADTSTKYTSLSPIWNTVICFEKIRMPGNFQWYAEEPPLISIELYDKDKKTDNYMGCGFQAINTIISNSDLDSTKNTEENVKTELLLKSRNTINKYNSLKTLSPPPLKWVPIAVDGSIRAEILMSSELIELTTNEVDVHMDVTAVEPSLTIGIPDVIRPIMKNYILEVVFVGFRNYTKFGTFATNQHRVKVMMADLFLISGITTSRMNNSINFLGLYASGIVSLPEQLEYWPAIIATDVVVSARGQETTLGAVLISNSKYFLQHQKTEQNWLTSAVSEVETEISMVSTILKMELEEHLQTHEEDKLKSNELQPLLNGKHRTSLWHSIFKSSAMHTENNENVQKASHFNRDSSDSSNDCNYNWWTKFYNSLTPASASKARKHSLTIYQNELEKQSEFSFLNDWAEPFKMLHGRKYNKSNLSKEEVYATLKMKLKLTPCQCNEEDSRAIAGSPSQPLAMAINPKYQTELKSLSELVRIIVRVYIVQGVQFRPKALSTQTDSYIKVQYGLKQMSNRAHYIPHESNPIFGMCFELDGLMPREHILEITAFNHNQMNDEIIGSTQIDLEDRWRSKHRATVGLANEYSSYGYNKWRDVSLPSEILCELCKYNDIAKPKFRGHAIDVDGVVFTDATQISKDEYLQESLSLTALRNLEKLPSFGYKLVEEHVETRSLYRPDCPGIEQGKLQLWIELFDGNINIPAAIDLTPQPPKQYELRVIVWNVKDAVLDEKNLFGVAMSDLFVRCWCNSPDETQSTDVHYRSTNGEGKFNWRMLFPMKYSAAEDMMFMKRRNYFLEEYELKQPPKLFVQLWDDDIVTTNDFLGSLELQLSQFPEPYPSAEKCSLPYHYEQRRRINLFQANKIKGWFPVCGPLPSKDTSMIRHGLTGKIELELEIVAEAEALAYPVGLGRKEPNALKYPNRPKTSFHPYRNPFKTFRHVIFPKLGKYLCILFILFILGLGLFELITFSPLIISRMRSK